MRKKFTKLIKTFLFLRLLTNSATKTTKLLLVHIEDYDNYYEYIIFNPPLLSPNLSFFLSLSFPLFHI